jgi:hypothetical protein
MPALSRKRRIPKVGEFSQLLFLNYGANFCSAWRKLEILPFSRIGTVDAIILASANHGRNRSNRRLTMTNSYTSRVAAAASAFMLSLVLLTATATTPSVAHAANTVTIGDVA